MLQFNYYFKTQNSFADPGLPCSEKVGILFHNAETFEDKLKILKDWLYYLDLYNKDEILEKVKNNYYKLEIPLVITDMKWNSSSKQYDLYIPEGKIV